MVLMAIKCPHCESPNVGKHGADAVGKTRYMRCRTDCGKTFQDNYAHGDTSPIPALRFIF